MLPTASRNPSRSVLAAVPLITAGMLLFEVLQSITLSLQVFAQNAFLVVSLAMLGLGAGGSLATYLSVRRRSFDPLRVMWLCSLAFPASLVATGALASRIESLEWLVLASLTPYVFVGLFLSVLFAAWPEGVGRSYAADLLGSAAGCLILPFLIRTTGSAATVTLLAALAGFLAAAVLASHLSRTCVAISLTLAAGVVALVPFEARLFAYSPSPEKHYGQILRDPGITTALEWSRWDYLGRLDVVRPGAGIERFLHGAQARATLDRGGDWRYLFASGDNWSYAVRFADARHAADFARTSIASAPYRATNAADVLVIGAGGGIDVFLAVSHRASSIVAVDINPRMIEAARNLGAGWWQGALFAPQVRYRNADGRTFVETTPDRYDVITLTAVDTGAAAARGGLVLSESYLYTLEAFTRYFDVLKPGGVVFVLRPRPHLVRVAATAARALERGGASHPERHFAVIGGGQWCGMLIFRDPVAPEALARLERALGEGLAEGAVVYLPSRPAPDSAFTPVFSAMSRGRLDQLIQSTPAVEPIRDDWPFFYHQHKSLLDSPAGSLLERIGSVVGGAAVLLIGLPLLGAPLARGRRHWSFAIGYFGGIGLGFMLAEIALIQKLGLYLGHPVYSLTVTLFVLLLSTAVGSRLSERQTEAWAAAHRPHVLLGAAGMLLLLAFGLPRVLAWLLVPSLSLRVLCAAALLAPLGVVMGMAFPLGIRALAVGMPRLIPWAWALNAVASVFGATLAVAVALVAGFTAVLVAAAAAYGVGALVALVVRQRAA